MCQGHTKTETRSRMVGGRGAGGPVDVKDPWHHEMPGRGKSDGKSRGRHRLGTFMVF